MVDDNVSFTDAGNQTGADVGGDKGGSSAMLDLLGEMNKEPGKKSKSSGKKKGKKEKKGKKGKTKMVRKSDKFESQNFLFRIEGAIFCSVILTGSFVLFVFILLGIVFGVKTNGHLVNYMHPIWGTTDENSGN